MPMNSVTQECACNVLTKLATHGFARGYMHVRRQLTSITPPIPGVSSAREKIPPALWASVV
eukprot:6000946-Pyramimonas_sp.AAC.1